MLQKVTFFVIYYAINNTIKEPFQFMTKNRMILLEIVFLMKVLLTKYLSAYFNQITSSKYYSNQSSILSVVKSILKKLIIQDYPR